MWKWLRGGPRTPTQGDESALQLIDLCDRTHGEQSEALTCVCSTRLETWGYMIRLFDFTISMIEKFFRIIFSVIMFLGTFIIFSIGAFTLYLLLFYWSMNFYGWIYFSYRFNSVFRHFCSLFGNNSSRREKFFEENH